MPVKDLPLEWRRRCCQARRWVGDWWAGRLGCQVEPRGSGGVAVGPCGPASAFPCRIRLTQRILPTESVDAKRHNLALARALIEDLEIPPEGILSFWRVVGRPTEARGFQAGRSLRGGRLCADFGGGLCQLAGLLYSVGLAGGLRVVERHAHSRDIYTDATRFAPPGADAAVAYGLKDLRLENTLGQPLCFRIVLAPGEATCALCAPGEVPAWRVEHRVIERSASICRVETRRWPPGSDRFGVVAVSRYRVEPSPDSTSGALPPIVGRA